eukprot:4468415-Amphidinium_carterae.1
MFIIQHYLYKVPYLLQRAGLSAPECNKIFQHFDHNAGRFFTKVNQRPLSMTPLSEKEERRQLEALRPEPARRQHRHDLTEEDTAQMNDDYDETQSTTRAAASASTSLKRKITEDTSETKKKQADIINNFHHVSIRHLTQHQHRVQKE